MRLNHVKPQVEPFMETPNFIRLVNDHSKMSRSHRARAVQIVRELWVVLPQTLATDQQRHHQRTAWVANGTVANGILLESVQWLGTCKEGPGLILRPRRQCQGTGHGFVHGFTCLAVKHAQNIPTPRVYEQKHDKEAAGCWFWQTSESSLIRYKHSFPAWHRKAA